MFVLHMAPFRAWGLGPEGMTYSTEVGPSFPIGSILDIPSLRSQGWTSLGTVVCTLMPHPFPFPSWPRV